MLGAVPMLVSSLFLFATYQGTITGIIGARIESQLQRNSTIQVLLMLLFVFIISTLAAFVVSRSISRPLGVLTEAVRRIAKGNLNVHIKVARQDEIGALGDFFNEMISEIKGSLPISFNVNKLHILSALGEPKDWKIVKEISFS